LQPIRATFYYFCGIFFLFLAWAASKVRGYSTPTPNDSSVETSVRDVTRQFDWWTKYLGSDVWRGKRVLELCPGDTLGVGVLALKHGATSYTAFDMSKLEKPQNTSAVIGRDKLAGESLVYLVDPNFRPSRELAGQKFDLIISNAAFEHFDNPEQTIRDISDLAAEGCVTAHEVDFKTHTRWIRDHDPNNIYRYSRWLYRLFSFPGQPNRWRPGKLATAFSQAGWKDVRIVHQTNVDSSPYHLAGLDAEFSKTSDMRILNCTMVATR
jgi:Methyltransferase domain